MEEDDEENAEEDFPDAHSQKLPSIGNDGRRQEPRGGDMDETFANSARRRNVSVRSSSLARRAS